MTLSVKTLKKKLFLFCVIAISFFYGVGVGKNHWFPYEIIRSVAKMTYELHNKNHFLEKTSGQDYIVETWRTSYFSLDENGFLSTKNGTPYRNEGIFRFSRRITPQRTAVIVMDPWIDAPSDYLNKYYMDIMENSLIPTTKKALELGYPVIVMTNNPTSQEYSTKIHPYFDKLVHDGSALILYHQEFRRRDFAKLLASKNINTLIYMGFASNMCVIGRPMGMIPMRNLGLKCFFIPEASAAVEYNETWQSGSIHEITTVIISQWLAEIINMESFLNQRPID